jgi:hypothetical protein
MKKINFHVDCPSELSAGLLGFTDDIEITVKSGDPGGENGEFEEYMKEAIQEWYDNGAKITLETK